MAGPNSFTRQRVFTRDSFRCVKCLTLTSLQFQHRVAVGSGGTKHRPSAAEGAVLCAVHNDEAEGSMNRVMLSLGLKLPQRHNIARNHELALNIPIRYCDGWYLVDDLGARNPVTDDEARERFIAWFPQKTLIAIGVG